jgi:hypothetical protein
MHHDASVTVIVELVQPAATDLGPGGAAVNVGVDPEVEQVAAVAGAGPADSAYGRTVKRLAPVLALALALAVAPGYADARQGGRIDWLVPNWYAGVQMMTSDPSAADPHVHVRFKRVGGEGQRQVRMGERHKKPGSHQWAPYTYTKPVKLSVGEKVVFTTQAALPCEPAKEPLGVSVDMRVKMPGKPWSRWETWIVEDHFLLDCSDRR